MTITHSCEYPSCKLIRHEFEPTVPPILTLDALNALARADFVAALGEIFEHAPWVADEAYAAKPFSAVAQVHDAMMQALRNAPEQRQLAVIRAHPELGSKVARAELTDASRTEQGSLALDRLSDEDFTQFQNFNSRYRDRFDFPFIICVRRHTRDSILRQFRRRLDNDAATERNAALGEIALITRLRLAGKIDGPGKPKSDGRLSTHLLDLTSGRPARGVAISLYEVGANARGLLMETISNIDGRTDKPLISDEPLRIGTYELQFQLGGYFGTGKSFLDTVPVRFSIAEPEGHYHIPLLFTPWCYTSYRGS